MGPEKTVERHGEGMIFLQEENKRNIRVPSELYQDLLSGRGSATDAGGPDSGRGRYQQGWYAERKTVHEADLGALQDGSVFGQGLAGGRLAWV